MKNSYFSFAKALRRAFEGLSYVFKTQTNFRIQICIAFIVLLAAFIFKITLEELIVIFFTILLVLAAEMINTAFESFTNLVGSQWDQQAKIAKDVAAGMVFVTSLGAAVIGLLIFIPYLQAFF